MNNAIYRDHFQIIKFTLTSLYKKMQDPRKRPLKLPSSCLHKSKYLTSNPNCQSNAELCFQKCPRTGHIDQPHEIVEIDELVAEVKKLKESKIEVSLFLFGRLEEVYKEHQRMLYECYMKAKGGIQGLYFRDQEEIGLIEYIDVGKFHALACSHVSYLKSLSAENPEVTKKASQIVQTFKNLFSPSTEPKTSTQEVSKQKLDEILNAMKNQFKNKLDEERKGYKTKYDELEGNCRKLGSELKALRRRYERENETGESRAGEMVSESKEKVREKPKEKEKSKEKEKEQEKKAGQQKNDQGKKADAEQKQTKSTFIQKKPVFPSKTPPQKPEQPKTSISSAPTPTPSTIPPPLNPQQPKIKQKAPEPPKPAASTATIVPPPSAHPSAPKQDKSPEKPKVAFKPGEAQQIKDRILHAKILKEKQNGQKEKAQQNTATIPSIVQSKPTSTPTPTPPLPTTKPPSTSTSQKPVDGFSQAINIVNQSFSGFESSKPPSAGSKMGEEINNPSQQPTYFNNITLMTVLSDKQAQKQKQEQKQKQREKSKQVKESPFVQYHKYQEQKKQREKNQYEAEKISKYTNPSPKPKPREQFGLFDMDEENRGFADSNDHGAFVPRIVEAKDEKEGFFYKKKVEPKSNNNSQSSK